MRLAICGVSPAETRYLCECVQALCAQAGCRAELCPVDDLAQLWAGFGPGAYQGVLVGVGDTAGFLAARRIRELDARCRLVVVDDTPRYAIQCLRIHAADFVLRPLQPEALRRACRRLAGLE